MQADISGQEHHVSGEPELCFLSAVQALDLFRARALSPVELLDALIARDTAVGEEINAFTWRFHEEARVAAKAAEARYMGHGPDPRPLEGLAVAIKESQAVAGQPLTHASLLHANDIATSTSVAMQRILDAGGVVHARTTMPEFAVYWGTHSRLFGVTHNPWHRDYDPGGSSGGAAAALAAGMTTLATGGDTAGSLRLPAACCGVVGYKPPYGRVPLPPIRNFDSYLTYGPMARTVADCALLFNRMVGVHPSDTISLREQIEAPVHGQRDLRGWKIALSLDLGGWEVDPDIQANTLAAAEALRVAGAQVEEVDLAWNRQEINEAVLTHYLAKWLETSVALPPEVVSLLTPYVAAAHASLADLPPGQIARGLQLEAKIAATLGLLLEEYRVLLCPTMAIPAMRAGASQPDPFFDTVTWQVVPGAAHLMTTPFNICNRSPVLAVPSGIAANGVPTGVQIVGRTYADADVFVVGAALERQRPWLDRLVQRMMA